MYIPHLCDGMICSRSLTHSHTHTHTHTTELVSVAILCLTGVCVYYCSTYYKAVRVGGGGFELWPSGDSVCFFVLCNRLFDSASLTNSLTHSLTGTHTHTTGVSDGTAHRCLLRASSAGPGALGRRGGRQRERQGTYNN